jgi:hypothetical protein
MGRRAACRIAASVPGVRVTKTYSLFTSHEGPFCEFELKGECYLIEEPFQDNSRYWVGPKHAAFAGSLGVVQEHFLSSKSGALALVTGAALVLAIVGVAGYSVGGRFLAQDRCLDAGGRWNGSDRKCEGARRDG